jgi:CheY-like chemotaxis protein
MPRILILDDEPLIAAMLADWLVECACSPVGPAMTAAEAMQLIEGETPDGAILDVSLAESDSSRVAEVLRGQGVPFAFATGYGVEGLPDGFEGVPVLAKPFDFEDVRGLIARLLAGSAAGS